MPIRVKCEKCKKTLSVKDHLAGKKIKCPRCQGVVAVPLASPTKEPPATVKERCACFQAGARKRAPQQPAHFKKSTAANPALKSKPAPGKPETNGAAPPANGEKSNGHVPSEPPPENVDEEALAALADGPPPPEEVKTPTTIDFKCEWCDEEVKLPFELAGKQAQCPKIRNAGGSSRYRCRRWPRRRTGASWIARGRPRRASPSRRRSRTRGAPRRRARPAPIRLPRPASASRRSRRAAFWAGRRLASTSVGGIGILAVLAVGGKSLLGRTERGPHHQSNQTS